MNWHSASPLPIERANNQRSVSLEAVGLRVAYGTHTALTIPHLQVRGRCVAVIGHNGSGKSTFLKTTLGLLTPRAGELRTSYGTTSERMVLVPETDMAFSPENGAVFADITVENYVKLWCRIKYGRGNYYKKEGAPIVDLLSLSPLLAKLGRTLSKGERRRVQTAVGLLTRPKLFCFDEPFDGLDVQQSSNLSAIMNDVIDDMALLISSHRMDVVERLADVIIVLKNGAVHTAGTVEEVCGKLCNQSVLIRQEQASGSSPLLALAYELRGAFSPCLVHRVGSSLSITGKDIDMQLIAKYLDQYKLTNVRLEQVRPTLTDAMSYHLSMLEQSAERAA